MLNVAAGIIESLCDVRFDLLSDTMERHATPRNAASLANAAFFIFLVPQFGFWPLRPLRAERQPRFGSSQKPGCDAVAAMRLASLT
jgi:hypothetical protein